MPPVLALCFSPLSPPRTNQLIPAPNKLTGSRLFAGMRYDVLRRRLRNLDTSTAEDTRQGEAVVFFWFRRVERALRFLARRRTARAHGKRPSLSLVHTHPPKAARLGFVVLFSPCQMTRRGCAFACHPVFCFGLRFRCFRHHRRSAAPAAALLSSPCPQNFLCLPPVR